MKREDLDFTSALVDDVKGMKIGIPRDYFGEGLDEEVKEAVLEAAKATGRAKEPSWRNLIWVWWSMRFPPIMSLPRAEASSNLCPF